MILQDPINISSWKKNAKSSKPEDSTNKLIFDVFFATIDVIYDTRQSGACHNTSASIYILLSEKGLDPTLCIGTVKDGNDYFDHSWIEVNGEIYDASICAQNSKSSPPIYASTCLQTNKPTSLNYGYPHHSGYDDDTELVMSLTLAGYASLQDKVLKVQNIWDLSKTIAEKIRFKIEPAEIAKKYSHIKRKKTINNTPLSEIH